jgi:serine/threonine protein kinase
MNLQDRNGTRLHEILSLACSTFN